MLARRGEIPPPCGVPTSLRVHSVLQHAGVEPFLDQTHDTPVRDPVLDELHEAFVVDGVEEATNVRIEHPVHLLPTDPDAECVQRLMWAASRSKSVGETEESSSAGEFHPRALTEPDVRLSPHPALTPQPRAARPVASARRGLAPVAQAGRANAWRLVLGCETACISVAPMRQGPR